MSNSLLIHNCLNNFLYFPDPVQYIYKPGSCYEVCYVSFVVILQVAILDQASKLTLELCLPLAANVDLLISCLHRGCALFSTPKVAVGPFTFQTLLNKIISSVVMCDTKFCYATTIHISMCC